MLRRLSCGLAVLALGMAAASAAEPASRGWYTDYAKAEAEAKRTGVPLIIHFHAEWCGPCKKMDADVLLRPEMMKELATRAVGVKVDSDHRPDLVTRHGITALPSDVIVGPEGTVLARTSGIQDRTGYLGRVAGFAARYEQARAARIAATKPAAPQIPPKAAETHAIAEMPKDSSIPDPVGLAGFSPVALTKDQKWLAGREEYSSSHLGIEYRMSSKEELEQFNSDPDKFAPKFLGCDAMILSTTERAVSGNIKFGAFWRGSLYLFYSEQNRKHFLEEPQKYAEITQAIEVHEIELLTSN